MTSLGCDLQSGSVLEERTFGPGADSILAIDILTSMFTAILVVRPMVVTWLRQPRPRTVPI